jgi:hypothetical protein
MTLRDLFQQPATIVGARGRRAPSHHDGLDYTTPYQVRQPLGEHIDLDQADADLLAFARSFEAKKGPPRGAQQPVG